MNLLTPRRVLKGQCRAYAFGRSKSVVYRFKFVPCHVDVVDRDTDVLALQMSVTLTNSIIC